MNHDGHPIIAQGLASNSAPSSYTTSRDTIYELEDLKDLIEKVLGRVHKEIELHFLGSATPFVRSGSMAIPFNGDRFIVRIDPDGRLTQFYIPD
jgi:hypothetical protein